MFLVLVPERLSNSISPILIYIYLLSISTCAILIIETTQLRITDMDWLSTALDFAATAWLKEFLRELLPAIKDLQNTPEDHAKAQEWDAKLKALFVKRGLTTPSQQKNRIADVRNAIRSIDPNHPALDDIKLPPEDYRAINNAASDKVAERETKFIDDPQAIADRAEQLLSSRETSDIAAGLAVLTGRRSTEILKTAQFEHKTPYSVTFTGALKRQGETATLSFEIPTLCPAEKVITSITKLRKRIQTANLTNREINKKYSESVAKACDKHFSDFVPVREGEDNLYTHLFRSVYATIAAYWYCPPDVPDLEFRAAIQGHYFILDENDKKLRRNLATERHYYDYKISDGNGNVDGRLGIRLGNPGVEVLEAFRKGTDPIVDVVDMPEPVSESETKTHRQMERILCSKEQKQQLKEIQERFNKPTQPEALAFVYELAQITLSLAEKLETQPTEEAINQQIESLKESASQDNKPSPGMKALDFLAYQIETLQQENQQLKSRLERLKELEQNNAQLQGEIAQLRESYQQFEALQQQFTTLSQFFGQQPQSKNQAQPTSIEQKPQQIQQPKESKPQETPKSSSKRDKPDSSNKKDDDVERAIFKIMEINNSLSDNHEGKWLISISLLKQLQLGKGQGKITQTFDTLKPDIDAHNDHHGLGAYHNRGKDISKLRELLQV
jgi:TolA-binding protein